MSLKISDHPYPHLQKTPQFDDSVLVLPTAVLVGDVALGPHCSVWYHTVLRGDVNYIRVGEGTNIQDGTVVHVSYKTFPTIIGNFVTIGHAAIVHGCTVGDFSLIGMGSSILDGAEIGDHVLLGAGSLVTPGTKIPSGMKALGRPARVIAPLTLEEREGLRKSAEHYIALSQAYR